MGPQRLCRINSLYILKIQKIEIRRYYLRYQVATAVGTASLLHLNDIADALLQSDELYSDDELQSAGAPGREVPCAAQSTAARP